MILATQFRALATVGAGGLNIGPGFVDEARDGIALPAERRHPPGMDDVTGGGEEADLLADRHHQVLVDFKQIVRHGLGVDAGFQLAGHVAVIGEGAEEVDAFVQILVVPFPLITGDLDGHVGVGHVLHHDQGVGGGNGHANQDQEWDDGPQDFDLGALVPLCSLGAGRLAEGNDGIEDGAKNDHTDDDTKA